MNEEVKCETIKCVKSAIESYLIAAKTAAKAERNWWIEEERKKEFYKYLFDSQEIKAKCIRNVLKDYSKNNSIDYEVWGEIYDEYEDEIADECIENIDEYTEVAGTPF